MLIIRLLLLARARGPSLKHLQFHLLIVQHALVVVVERHEVEVHVLDAVVLKDTLLLYQLAQVQIIQQARLRERKELVVVERRLVALLVNHRVVLDHIPQLTLMIAHIKCLLLGGHHVGGRGDACVAVLPARRSRHVRRRVERCIGVVVVLQLDGCVGGRHGSLLLQAARLTSCRGILARDPLHAVSVYLLHGEGIVVSAVAAAWASVPAASAHELLRAVLADDDVLLAADATRLLGRGKVLDGALSAARVRALERSLQASVRRHALRADVLDRLRNVVEILQLSRRIHVSELRTILVVLGASRLAVQVEHVRIEAHGV